MLAASRKKCDAHEICNFMKFIHCSASEYVGMGSTGGLVPRRVQEQSPVADLKSKVPSPETGDLQIYYNDVIRTKAKF